MSDSISRAGLLQYSLMALPLAFIGMPLYIHAPDFYITQTGLSLAAIGTALLLIRLFDAVQDPIIGYLEDRFFPYRRGIILVALGFLALGFWMLFNPYKEAAFVWFCVSLLIASTAFSVLTIFVNALGSLWSDEETQKTRITMWREGFGLIGLLIAAILPTLLGFEILSLVLPILLFVAGFVFLRWDRGRDFPPQQAKTGFRFRLCFSAPFPLLYAICGLSMLASAIPAALVIFFIRDYLNAESLTGLFLMLYFLSGAFGMPVWKAVAARYGALEALLGAMVLAIITFIGAYGLSSGDLWAYGLICVLSGFALGAELALPPAILSRMIDQKDQRAQTAFHFSILAFLSKFSLAVGSGIALIVLGWSAFQPNAANTPAALDSLVFTYALLPCLLKACACAALFLSLKTLKTGERKCVTSSSPSAWELS